MNKKLIWFLIALAIIGVLIAGFFVFASTVTIKKPAIYLYPKQDSFVNVKVDVNGKIIKDIPKYNLGWNVFVTKDGMIDGKYDYLFYEAELRKIDLPSDGWVVKYENLESWFDVNLIKLGLNEKEKNQFKEYWLNELPESNYYEIKLFDEKFLKENMNLIITPNSDTLIRLIFYFKPLRDNISISKPKIVIPTRNGFTVVEWGGMLDI
jgi:hypothetical protein